MSGFIKLNEVVYDDRARSGVWCMSPYPDHPKGCPNFPACIKERPDFQSLSDREWYAIIEEFDLATHAEEMKRKHPHWSERQCRNLLYWQNGVRSRLLKKTRSHANPLLGDIILDIPEACGVNMFETLSKAGVTLQRTHPNYIIKAMLIGKHPVLKGEIKK